MKLLTLNMNMFNLDIDKSFDRYFDSICPDIAFIQECRYNRIDKSYNPKWAGNYDGIIDSRIHLSVAVSKSDKKISKSMIKPIIQYDYACIFVECEGNRFAGVHLPIKNKENENDYEKICLKLKDSDSKIICGDFNACSNNSNQKYVKELLGDDEYIDLWREGLIDGNAYYIDFSGQKTKADAKKHLRIRTFVGNTHIDYILAKKDFLTLKEIIIDFRTLAFTDHCSIILEFDIVQNCK